MDLELGPGPVPARPGHHDVVHPRRDPPGEELVPLVDRVVEGALQVDHRTGGPPRRARVTVTRLSGAQPVPWIRKTVAGSPMGCSGSICGDPLGAAGNTDGGGPGGGFSAAAGDAAGPALFPGPASWVPTMAPAATSAAAAVVTAAAIRARRRRCRAGGAAIASPAT